MRRRSLVLVAGLLLAPAALAQPIASGTVLAADGTPAAEARVDLLPLAGRHTASGRILAGRFDPDPVTSAVTDERGRFRLTAPAAGLWRVVARREGHLSMHYLPLALVEPTELPPVSLPPAVHLEVRAAGGAWVWTAARGGVAAAEGGGWNPDFRAGRTDAAGRIVLPMAAGEELDVSVLAAGALIETRPTAETLLTVRTAAGHPGVRPITVSDRGGRPLADVVIHSGPPRMWPLGRTDAAGRLSLAASPEARDLVLVAADGRHQTVELAAGDGPAAFRLADPVTLAGRVVDAGRRRPIAGAVVWSGADPGAFALTDAEGRYRLTAPRTDRFWLQAEAAGHLPRRMWIGRDHLGGGQAPTIALPAAAAVAGRVVDRDGRPLAGVEVTARVRANPPYFRPDPADDRTATDARGRFRLDRLEPGTRQLLTASRAGFAESRRELTTPESGETAEGVEVVLAPVRHTHGRVLEAEDRPVAGAEVVLTAAGRPLPEPAAEDDGRGRARTGADGRFAELAAPADAVTLTVFKEGFAPTLVRGLEVPPGAASFDLGTVYLVPGLALAGTVVDSAGEGIAGAEVFLVRGVEGEMAEQVTQEVGTRRPQTVSGDDGRFTLRDLVAGERVHLLVRGAGYRSVWRQHVEIPAAADLTIRLEPAQEVRGRVVDETGEPIAEAGVRVSWQRPAAPDLPPTYGVPESRVAGSDAEGRFAVADLPPGDVTLEVLARGFVPAEPRTLALPVAEEVIVTLARGAALTGTAATRRGEPIMGLTVSLDGPAAARTDADGRYRIEGVPPGPARVTGRHRHFGRRVETIEIEAGVNVLDLIFDDGVPVSGRVVDPGGLPLAGALVELAGGVAFDSRIYRARSDTGGAFRLEPVIDGDYRMAVRQPGFVTPEPPPRVTVAGEAVEDLEVVVPRGATITGAILGLDFDELAQVRVEAESATGSSQMGRVRYDGRYEIRDLAAGDWLLRAVVGAGRRQAQARVTLETGVLEASRDLEFAARLTLSGQVLHDGEPLSGARLLLTAYELSVERAAVSDHEGRFQLEDLAEGRYHLGLSHSLHHLVHNQDVELFADRELVIDLRPARLAGTVRATGGETVAEALVLLRRLVELGGEENLLTTGTDGGGAFRFPRVPAGRYRLSVRKDGYAADEQVIALAAGADERGLELEVRPTRGVELAVRLADGSTPPRVDVAVYDARGGLLLLESRDLDAEGGARLPTVPPGTWRLVVSAPGAAPAALAATVPGEPLAVELEPASRLAVRVPSLALSDLVATLTLFGADGEPYRGFDELVGLRESWPLVAGRAVVDRLPAGPWTLTVTTADGRSWAGAAATVPGAEVEISLE